MNINDPLSLCWSVLSPFPIGNRVSLANRLDNVPTELGSSSHPDRGQRQKNQFARLPSLSSDRSVLPFCHFAPFLFIVLRIATLSRFGGERSLWLDFWGIVFCRLFTVFSLVLRLLDRRIFPGGASFPK